MWAEESVIFQAFFFDIKPRIRQIEWCLAPTNLFNFNLNHSFYTYNCNVINHIEKSVNSQDPLKGLFNFVIMDK